MFWRSVFDSFNLFSSSKSSQSATDVPIVNPATGLPMLGDSMGGVDIGGSPFGIDSHGSAMENLSSLGSKPWD